MNIRNTFNKHTAGTDVNRIPDIEIIDLDLDENIDSTPMEDSNSSTMNELPEYEEQETENTVSETESSEDDLWEETDTSKKGIRAFLNIHVLLLVVFLVFVSCIIFRFSNWGERIDISQIGIDDSDGYLDVLDQILPLVDSEGNRIDTGKVDTIVAFGNAPFSDNRGSEDNLANMIADATGATVYNCSVSGSYLAAQWPFFDANQAPMDAYCFYWLVTLGTSGANSNYYESALNVLGDDAPPEAREVYDMLTTLDFSTVDVVTVMYDASDYLMGHAMYDDSNATNIEQFTGNLEAGIELLQATYPNIRIIVMSPTYAYAVDENGDYVSSDMYVYGDRDVLSTYVIKEYASCASRSVSFIDHLYGTITEANAKDYLIDNIHLNTEGRKLVAKRFVDALTRYN